MNMQSAFNVGVAACWFCVQPATVFWVGGTATYGFCRDHEPTADWQPGDKPTYVNREES